MTSRIHFSALARAAAVVAAAALLYPAAQAQPAKPASPMPAMAASSSMPMSMPMPMPASGKDMKSMMKDMGNKMSSMSMSGNQDIDFATMMRIHHQGAIDMAQVELKAGKEPKMRKMAKAIIAAQKKEIAGMDKFLASHGHSTDKMKK